MPPPLPREQPVTLADFKTPGAELEGVRYLRNVQDADALIATIAACKAAGGKVRAPPSSSQALLSALTILAPVGTHACMPARTLPCLVTVAVPLPELC